MSVCYPLRVTAQENVYRIMFLRVLCVVAHQQMHAHYRQHAMELENASRIMFPLVRFAEVHRQIPAHCHQLAMSRANAWHIFNLKAQYAGLFLMMIAD